MKRQFYVVLVAGFLATGLAGCGAKERQELQQKVAGLEQQLVKANSELAAKLAKVQVERDKLKQEVAQLKKKKRG
jgi:phage shock protein A